MADLILKSQGISKRFGGVQALDKIDFELRQGEVHALVGENGAGKSTYIKILAGVYQKDEGESVYDGRKINFRSNLEARQQGIGMVPQLIDLAPKLTVAENIYMGVYPRTRMGFIDWKKLYSQAETIAKTFGMEGMVRTPVERLGTGHRQLIEVLKALIYDTKIIAFDEPTAALSDEETRWLFDLIRTLRGKGISVIYVSHRLDELFQIADRVSVLKDGQYVGTREIAEINKGEILGCFGMVGSGRTETAMAVFGADEKDEGVITLKGETVHIGTPTQAVRLGVGLVPENRITQGVILKAAIRNNITLPFVNRLAKKRAGFIDMREEKVISANYMAQLKVKAPHDLAKVVTLSGGNQQKVSIAKWLATRSDVIIFDEPTHGIDVGAKADIYRLLRGLSEEGKGVVMISSELPEVLNVCDRILVFRDGKIVHEFTENKGLTEEEVVAYAIG